VRVRHAQPAAGTTSHCRRGPATPVDPLLLQFQPYSEALLTCRGPSRLPMREDALLKGADRARLASPGPAASFSSHHHLLHLLLFIHLPGRTRRTAASEIARPRLVPSPLGSAPLTHGENSACSVGLAGGRGRGLVRPAAAGPLPPSLPPSVLPSIALSPSSPESRRLPAKFRRFTRWICEAIAPSGPKVAALSLTSRVLVNYFSLTRLQVATGARAPCLVLNWAWSTAELGFGAPVRLPVLRLSATFMLHLHRVD
jgi:hypothetical protein